MHICMDEILAFMAVLPVVGIFIRTYSYKIHQFFHRKKCPHDHKHTGT